MYLGLIDKSGVRVDAFNLVSLADVSWRLSPAQANRPNEQLTFVNAQNIYLGPAHETCHPHRFALFEWSDSPKPFFTVEPETPFVVIDRGSQLLMNPGKLRMGVKMKELV